MGVRRHVVTVVTDGSGAATAYTPNVRGRLRSVAYKKAGSGGYTDGVDFAITGETSGVGIWTESDVNASTVRHPGAATHSNAGVAALYAAGGTAVLGDIALDERIKIVLAQGGASKTGEFHFTVED